MQSEILKVREDASAHQSAPKVRQKMAIDEPKEVAHDHKTFRVAVAIGLVMVGGLSLFLPDQEGGPTNDMMVMAPAPIKTPDVVQHASTDSALPQTEPAYAAINHKLDTLTDQLHRELETLRTDKADVKNALSTLAAWFDETQVSIAELHQGNEALRSRLSETQTQLKTLARAVQTHKVIRRQAIVKTTRPFVSTPPFQIDAIDRWDDLVYVAVSQKGQVFFLKVGEQQSGWTVTQIDRPKGQVGFRGPAGQAYAVSLQR